MKRIAAIFLLVSAALLLAGPYDWRITRRNSTDTGNETIPLPEPNATAVLRWDNATDNLEWVPHDFILPVAVSDEVTDLTTGTAKITFRAPYAFTFVAVRASVNTAPTGSTILVDINEAGSTVFSTRLSIDASEKTSVTAASAAVFSDTTVADDAEVTIDIDQIGSTIAGKGLKVVIYGKR